MTFPERGLTVCAAPQRLSCAWLHGLIEAMSPLGLNSLVLEAKIAQPDARLNTWAYYTPGEISGLVEHADRLGIEIIPLVNAPGHMETWLENRPDLQLRDAGGAPCADRLDISRDEALEFYVSLVDSYSEFFPAPWWHMGADEFMNNASWSDYPSVDEDSFIDFVISVRGLAASRGKRLRIWNDGLTSRAVRRLPRDIVIDYWKPAGPSPRELLAAGFELTNVPQYLYWSRSVAEYGVDASALVENDRVGPLFFDGEQRPAPARGIRGMRASIWPDVSDHQTERGVAREITEGMALLSVLLDPVRRRGHRPRAAPRPAPHRGGGSDPNVPGRLAIGDRVFSAIPTADGYHLLCTGGGGCVSGGAVLAMLRDPARPFAQTRLGVVSRVGMEPRLVGFPNAIDPAAIPPRGPYATDSDRLLNAASWAIEEASAGFRVRHALSNQYFFRVTETERHVDLIGAGPGTFSGAGYRPRKGSLAQFPADVGVCGQDVFKEA